MLDYKVTMILFYTVCINANIKRQNQTPFPFQAAARRHEHLSITSKHPRVSICDAIYIRYIYIQIPVSKYVSLSAFTGCSTYTAVNITPLTIFNQHFLKKAQEWHKILHFLFLLSYFLFFIRCWRTYQLLIHFLMHFFCRFFFLFTFLNCNDRPPLYLHLRFIHLSSCLSIRPSVHPFLRPIIHLSISIN